MSQELVSIVRAWPVIVQGALGSALFWIVLLVGQRLALGISSKYSHFSKEARRAFLISEQTKCLAALADEHSKIVTYTNLLLYRTSRHFLKAMMWLVLGLITGSLFGEFSVIGYVGCLYYLFKANQVVSPIPDSYMSVEKLKEITEELGKIRT